MQAILHISTSFTNKYYMSNLVHMQSTRTQRERETEWSQKENSKKKRIFITTKDNERLNSLTWPGFYFQWFSTSFSVQKHFYYYFSYFYYCLCRSFFAFYDSILYFFFSLLLLPFVPSRFIEYSRNGIYINKPYAKRKKRNEEWPRHSNGGHSDGYSAIGLVFFAPMKRDEEIFTTLKFTYQLIFKF